jgi:hypothetical protein
MNFADAANWVSQHWVDGAIVTVAVVAAEIGHRAYKAHRASYRASEEIVERFLSRPEYTGKSPPRTPRS